MFRMRRYRVFLVFAIIATGTLYHFTSLSDLETAGAASVEGIRNFGQRVDATSPPSGSKDATEPKEVDSPIGIPTLVASGSAQQSQATHTTENLEAQATSARPSQTAKPSVKDNIEAINPKATPDSKPRPSIGSVSTNKTNKPKTGPADPVLDGGGGGRLEIIAETGLPKIHWSQLPEHFPVPTESLIQLPTGAPKAIPRIQYEFAPETEDEETEREGKREVIKKAFLHSWAGYKKKAWMQDELSPVSGKFRNPFCAWGATLVDSLDTLYMMGLEDEFEEAVDAIKDIDFTTSPRNDIPLFETVIRYLGGLVAAYDICDGTRRILLDKAVELADILIGAFDTPNRMPMTFYLWKPTFASQPHRAKTRVVLAELGSLSVEFTRLAQITKEPKYYDAIARITNEFEIWQNNTRLPGLWPMMVDASGCKKPDVSLQQAYDHTATNGATDSKPLGIHDSENLQGLNIGDDEASKGAVSNTVRKDNGTRGRTSEVEHSEVSTRLPVDTMTTKNSREGDVSSNPVAATSASGDDLQDGPSVEFKGAIGKRDLDNESFMAYRPSAVPKAPECEPQGLASPPFASSEDFGIGGQADSTYEYLPKEYMLLGGLEDKYQTMYEMAADTITENLLYRGMIPDEQRPILHPGLAKISEKDRPWTLRSEGTHLGCFAGGMYAVGAKIFAREGDMKIAKELTDGCVWAYESTTTGIMPESYLAVQCTDRTHCPWNETFWHEQLDPYGDAREKNRLAQQQAVLIAKKEESGASDKVVSQEEPHHVASYPEETTALSQVVETPHVKSQLPGDKVGAQPGPSPDNNMFKSAEGIIGSPESPAAEQSAHDSAPLPAGGASVEQPLSPPGNKTPAKPLGKRQLGDLSEVQPLADTIETTAKAVPGSPVDHTLENVGANRAPLANSPSVGAAVETEQKEHVPLLRGANGTNNASSHIPIAATYTPLPIPTREEFVQGRIRDERLPAGMTKVTGARYLLRPEAIESVFIMYRATGDTYWREKGWDMFEAIQKYTVAEYGGSAINDVTKEEPAALDEMESFWLAETLKYFYLLFSQPNVVSLDDYVLNTEAHPFKRPK